MPPLIRELHINVDAQAFSDLLARLDRIEALLAGIPSIGKNIMATIDDLAVAIGDLKVKVESFGPAVDSLEQKIKDALAGENLSQATKDKIDAAFAEVTGLVGTAQTALDDAATQDVDGN
jgi:hypothetical protein